MKLEMSSTIIAESNKGNSETVSRRSVLEDGQNRQTLKGNRFQKNHRLTSLFNSF